MAVQLVPNVTLAHRWWSVRFAALGAASSVALVVFPGLLGFVNPYERPVVYGSISAAFFVVTLVARLIDQPSLDQ